MTICSNEKKIREGNGNNLFSQGAGRQCRQEDLHSL